MIFKQKSNKFISLAVKNAAFYISLILLSSILIGYFIYKISYEIVLKSSEQNALHTLEILNLKLESSVENARKDVIFIARSPYLKEYIRSENVSSDEFKKQGLTSDYISFLSSRPDYSQIRFIGRKDNGKEVLRVDRMNTSITVVNPNELQQKGSSAYFKETVDLPEDSVNFSIIDLNKEYGKISTPVMPTLRASCPVWFNNISYGIAIINVNLTSLFIELNELSKNDFEIYLIDSKGHALIHPDASKSFAFEYGKKESVFDELGILQLPGNKEKRVSAKGKVLYVNKVNYPKQNYSLYFIAQSKENKLLEKFINWKWSIAGITLMISSLFMFLALWWLQRQSKDMVNIVNSISQFEKNLQTSDLPIQRNDEIGIIANTFNTMAEVIKTNIVNLEKAKREAELANIQKEEFLQNMSHEIRNPLHTILGMTRMLESNEPNNEQIPIIESLKFSSNTLLSLVNDILDFSKLKEGKIILQPTTCNLYSLVNRIIKSYSFEAINKKISIQFNCDERIKQNSYEIDELRINQIIINLLSNALKFTPPNGQINILLHSKEESENVDLINFKITDTGPGIPKEKFNTIISRFEKLNDNDSMNQYGAGLGLPIVVQLLSLFKSKLLLDESGIGATFTFSIHGIRTKTEIKGFLDIPVKPITKMLIIDDDPQIIYWYKHIFSEKNYQLIPIMEASELNTLEDTSNFDIVITDDQVNDRSIIEILPSIKLLTHEKSVVIMVTGNHDLAQPLIKSKGLLDTVIQKPVNGEFLQEQIERLWLIKQNGVAEFQKIFTDYDGHKDKILNFYNILIEEWTSSVDMLKEAIQLRNNENKNKVIHKMANSLRKFGMNSVEQYWIELDLSQELDHKAMQVHIEKLTNSIKLAKIHASILST
ncbi:MAG: hypothetical protein HOP11_14220 [Saprospiraceae bacterium]|nr:hypothetical protein [Saprospiraceae bacterium]